MPKIDWDDPAARQELVSALVNDANALVAALEGRKLEEPACSAVALLALVAGQDVEPAEGSDATGGRWRIAPKVAEDRVISTVGPQVATWRGRRLKRRYRAVTRNNAWLKRRTAAVNPAHPARPWPRPQRRCLGAGHLTRPPGPASDNDQPRWERPTASPPATTSGSGRPPPGPAGHPRPARQRHHAPQTLTRSCPIQHAPGAGSSL